MAKTEKTKGEQLREELLISPKNGYDLVNEKELAEIEQLSADYKVFLKTCKTERDSVKFAVQAAEKAGFKPVDSLKTIKPGDRVYKINREKALALAVIGQDEVEQGVNIIASHIDAPRVDLKPQPLYEDSEICYFKTHYYGGIKKYQWTTIPLNLSGVVVLKGGKTVRVDLGADPADPVFVFSDLLPHLGKDQMQKPMTDAIPGESLNLIIGTKPLEDDKGSDRVKIAVMRLLNEKYGIVESDLISAELCLVPNADPRDVGFDRSMVGAYGHDDRVCAYTSLLSIIQTKAPKKTAVCFLADKEEVGSDGVSGMQSRFFEEFLLSLSIRPICLDKCFAGSVCISADVTNAFDPTFPEVSDKRNNARLNYGIALCKYTGARGKSGTSDASAELMRKIIDVLDGNKVAWQVATLGKVDQGGGGTVAMYMANRNIDTVDAGVPLLSMHAPYEVAAKMDIYMSCKAYSAFYKDCE